MSRQRVELLERTLRNVRNTIGPRPPNPRLKGAAAGMAEEIAHALDLINAVLPRVRA